MNISWGHLLFKFSGRINRAKWWLTILIIVVAQIVIEILQLVLPEGAGGVVVAILYLLVAVAGIWISLAAGTKRLHDLGRTGAWLVLFFGVPLLLGIVLVVDIVINIGAAALGSLNEEELLRKLTDEAFWSSVGVFALVVAVPIMVLGIWQLIWLGCLPGTPGPNQFGPDPRAQQVVPTNPRLT